MAYPDGRTQAGPPSNPAACPGTAAVRCHPAAQVCPCLAPPTGEGRWTILTLLNVK